jgi:hypothetical protein
LAEHAIRNREVIGSIPIGGSKRRQPDSQGYPVSIFFITPAINRHNARRASACDGRMKRIFLPESNLFPHQEQTLQRSGSGIK